MKNEDLVYAVIGWAEDRQLIDKKNVHCQMLKVVEEVGELSSAILKNNEDKIVDGIGDSFVTLIILSEQLGFDIYDCLRSAYREIRNRTGETKNGIFIKDNE